jgi:hypothetical protein
MDRRILTLPLLGFAATLIAALTLQPVSGSFSKAYRFVGDSGVAAASSDPPRPTPNSGVYPITVTPTESRLATKVPSSPTAGGSTPAATPTTSVGGTATAAPSATATSPAAPTNTATSTPAATSTATPRPAASATGTPAPTATPDPCALAREAQLVFDPATLSLRAAPKVQGKLVLANKGAVALRGAVLRITVVRGANYVSALALLGQTWTPGPSNQPFELKLGDIEPGATIDLSFEAAIGLPVTTLSSAAALPAVQMRFEVAPAACNATKVPEVLASATVTIGPVLQPAPVPVKPITEAEIDQAVSVDLG